MKTTYHIVDESLFNKNKDVDLGLKYRNDIKKYEGVVRMKDQHGNWSSMWGEYNFDDFLHYGFVLFHPEGWTDKGDHYLNGKFKIEKT
jgi:hypothetical protein